LILQITDERLRME